MASRLRRPVSRLLRWGTVLLLAAGLTVPAARDSAASDHRTVSAGVPHLVSSAAAQRATRRVRDITLRVDPQRRGPGAYSETWGDNLVFDKNADGNPDVLLSFHIQRWQIWLGKDGPGFTYDRSLVYGDRHNCAAADFAGPHGTPPDGVVDLYCVRGANGGTRNDKANWLLIQQPDGGFVDRIRSSGAADPTGRGRTVSVLDSRGDGRPSLFVGNASGKLYSSPDHIFVNVGRRFLDRHTGGLPSTQNSYCSSTGDFDRDGRQDFLSCSYQLRLYRNLTTPHRRVTYRQVARSEGVPAGHWTDAELVDLNRDGWPDLVMVAGHELQVRLNRRRSPHFSRLDYRLPLAAGFSLCTGRANGDAAPDLLVVQGLASTVDRLQRPDRMLVNTGSGKSFRVLSVPQPPLRNGRNGNGDSCSAIPDYRGRRAAWTINNGRPLYHPDRHHRGYRQLVILAR